MRLRDLRRTSGFRVALLFFVTFGAASLALFGFLSLKTRSYGRAGAYEWVAWETSRLMTLPPAALRERTESWGDFDRAERLLVVFDTKGHRISGADFPFPGSAKVGKSFQVVLNEKGHKFVYFSMLSKLPAGGFLLVSRSAKALQVLERGLVEVFCWGIGGTILIGLVGAITFGLSSLRQIEAVTSSAEQIMSGDLSGRLPSRGLSADLVNLIRVVNGMLDQIEHLMLETKNVNENIAHDLRTPLTRVLASLERSARHSTTAEAFRIVNDDVILEIKSIVTRFSALLRISELEDRLRRSGFVTVDLRNIVSDAVEYYEPIASEKNIAIRWIDRDCPCEMDGDPSLLFEAASNLLDNAIKFSSQGSEIRIAVTHDPAGFVIADSGPGIPQFEVTRVKYRFQRGGDPRTHSGFGIGLSLVDSIARLHNMQVVLADNHPGCRASLLRRADSRSERGLSAGIQSSAAVVSQAVV